MIASEGEIVPPDSVVFWKACYATVVFLVGALALGVVAVFFFWTKLEVATETIETPTYEWFQTREDVGLICPCVETQIQLKSFVSMKVIPWESCTLYSQLISAIGQGLQENLESKANYALLHVAEACKQAKNFAEQDMGLMGNSYIDSVVALTSKQLKTRVDIFVNRTKNIREQAYSLSYQQITSKTLLDSKHGFKNDVRLFNLGRKGCPDCTVKSPSGNPVLDDSFFVEGSNSSCCYNDYSCIIGRPNMTEACVLILTRGDTSVFGEQVSNLFKFSGFCTRLLVHPRRHLVDVPLRCSEFLYLQEYPTKALNALLELYLQKPTVPVDSETFGEAISKGELAPVSYTVANEAYYDTCKPLKCTYFVQDFTSRMIQSLALALALVIPIMNAMKITVVKVFNAIPDSFFSKKVQRVRSQTIELATTKNPLQSGTERRSTGTVGAEETENPVIKQSSKLQRASSVTLEHTDQWLELVDDESSTPYYHNVQTGVTQWEKPKCF